MMKKLALLLFLLVSFVSCEQKEKAPVVAGVEGSYTIEVPSNLAVMQELYPNADLQYGNTFLQRYLVSVHAEEGVSYEEFLANQLKNYSDREHYEIRNEEHFDVQGLATTIYEIEMSQGNDMMFMIQAFYKGSKGSYEVIQWCRKTDMESQRDLMLKTILTFKESI